MGAAQGAVVAAWIYRQRHAWYPRYRWVRALYRWNRDWVLYLPVVIAAFGCLALLPDTLYALGLLPKAVIRSDLFNLFYGYAWFERIEDIYPTVDWILNTVGSASLYLMALAILNWYATEAARRLDHLAAGEQADAR